MKYITMTVFDKKYKIKPGITTVGNTQFCHIQIPLPECFKLNYDQNFLWIQPTVNIQRINGFGQIQQLQAGKEYEIDISTGAKDIIAFDQKITFEFVKTGTIKINLVDKEKTANKSIEPPIVKKVQCDNTNKSVPKSPRKRNSIKQYALTKNYIAQLGNQYILKLSNCSISEDDLYVLFRMGIRVDPHNYNILVMESYKRTFNFLLALNEGKLIVNSQWIKDCLSTKQVQNPYLYVLKTNNFSILKSIEASLTNRVFLNKQFQLSPNITSNLKETEIIQLIKAGGGTIGCGQNSQLIVSNDEQGGIQIEELLQMILYQKV